MQSGLKLWDLVSVAKSSNLQQAHNVAAASLSSKQTCAAAAAARVAFIGLIVDQAQTKTLQHWAREVSHVKAIPFQIELHVILVVVRMAEAKEALRPPGHLRLCEAQ